MGLEPPCGSCTLAGVIAPMPLLPANRAVRRSLASCLLEAAVRSKWARQGSRPSAEARPSAVS